MFKYFFCFLLSIFITIQTSSPAFALGGPENGPCSASGDKPSIGNIDGGDENFQTYTNPDGRIINRVCYALEWLDGSIDHGLTRKNENNGCYEITGIGSSTVTVKRISETYEVADWQTGPEAGRCQPMLHLDVFLNPTPAPTAADTASTTDEDSDSDSDSNSDLNSDDNSSNDSNNSDPDSIFDKNTNANNNLQVNNKTNEENQNQVLGESEKQEDLQKDQDKILGESESKASSNFQLILISATIAFIFLILLTIWFLRKRQD
ncbi:MAG: hypothetical protein ABFQ62_01395 [Patescibacteria group bacterium]